MKRNKNGVFLSESFRREIGFTHPRCFSHHLSSSQGIVRRLELYGKLGGHRGCVNAIEFNSTGELLVSGSDDRQVILWNWAMKKKMLSYDSGHLENIFQTKLMPFTDDRTIVTSAADGQVRAGQMSEDGGIHTKRVGKHRGSVFKLALEPGSPYILYSGGEDGYVQHFDLRTDSSTKLFSCSSFTKEDKPSGSNRIRLNSVVINPRNPNHLAVAGSDEYVRVYDIRNSHFDESSNPTKPVSTFCPSHLRDSGNTHITGLAYSHSSELLASYNDELIYLFDEHMAMGSNPLLVSPEEVHGLDQPRVYTGHRNSRTVKGVNFFGPNDDYVVSGSDCGHVFVWDKKGGEVVRMMVGDKHIVNQIEQHPSIPVLATCGIDKSVKVWAPHSKKVRALPSDAEEIMESNRRGRENHSRVTLSPDVIMHVLRLQRRQTLAFVERRPNRDGNDSDDGDDNDDSDDGQQGEAYVLRFTDGDNGSDDDNPRECSIC